MGMPIILTIRRLEISIDNKTSLGVNPITNNFHIAQEVEI